MTTVLEGGEGSAALPGRSLPPGKTRYPLYRRLGGPQGRSGQVRKISPPSEFDPQTVQPVASRYTDYATRLTFNCPNPLNFSGYCTHHNVRIHKLWNVPKQDIYVPAKFLRINSNYFRNEE